MTCRPIISLHITHLKLYERGMEKDRCLVDLMSFIVAKDYRLVPGTHLLDPPCCSGFLIAATSSYINTHDENQELQSKEVPSSTEHVQRP